MLLGPRFFILFWWLANPNRWERAFDSFFWPALGFVFAPWTTLMYVAVFPGGVEGFDWFLIVLAALTDVASLAGGGYTNRNRLPAYATTN
jgi:hypothetical protein